MKPIEAKHESSLRKGRGNPFGKFENPFGSNYTLRFYGEFDDMLENMIMLVLMSLLIKVHNFSKLFKFLCLHEININQKACL